MTPPSTRHRVYSVSIGSPASYRIIGDPREWWPRESDLTAWLADHLDQLAVCLDLQCLDYQGREVVIGEQWTLTARSGRDRIVGGMRLDLAARDEQGRTVIVEVQFGPADHRHLAQLVTYANTVDAALAVWVIADIDPLFYAEHIATLAELNDVFTGRRQFCIVAVTVESAPSPVPLSDDVSLSPRLRRLDLRARQFVT